MFQETVLKKERFLKELVGNHVIQFKAEIKNLL